MGVKQGKGGPPVRPTLQEFDNVLGLIVGGLFLVRYMVPFVAPYVQRWQEKWLTLPSRSSVPTLKKSPG